MSTAAFDAVAGRYDAVWTNSPVGRLQRNAVWRHLDPLFHPGDAVLDLGCGTGEDALHLMQSGLRITAIDSSAEMVGMAAARGVEASRLAIEELDRLDGTFDGALSDFGALNCVRNLTPVASALARLIRPRGYLVLCTMGRFCLWETAHYALRLQFGKAFRRLRPRGAVSTLGVRVFYPSVRSLAAGFNPAFELVRWAGVGLCVPPSYISGLPAKTLARLDALDRSLAQWPVMRALADHRLLIFQRT